MQTYISASILSADFGILKEEILRAEKSGVDMIHFDVMDGVFVPNITFGQPVLKSIKKLTELTFDVHLMITDPIRYVDEFASAGADIITFHVESQSNPLETIEKIKSAGVKAGISIKPDTPVESILPFIDKVDMVLIMTVEPGFGGQGFIASTVEKISELRGIINDKGLNVDIQVDGGINSQTGRIVKNAGANNLVTGSYLFGADNMAKAVGSLKE